MRLSGFGFALRPSHATTPLTYELAWDLGAATVHADGSWTVVTDDGAEVTVTDGSLATWSATLLECPHGHGWLDGLAGVFAIASASAGQSALPLSPSRPSSSPADPNVLAPDSVARGAGSGARRSEGRLAGTFGPVPIRRPGFPCPP